MAQAFDEDNNLLQKAYGKDLRDAFNELEKKIKPEDKVTKVIVTKLTLEERIEKLEDEVALLLIKNIRLK